jgi:type IV fimbrial biogenesis protein FimT
MTPGSRPTDDRFRPSQWAYRSSGVTLIELLFAIAILAIIVAFATPSYREAQLASRLNAIACSLHASVLVARSEAIKANAPTTLCASADDATCAASGDWEQGWIVLNADGAVIQKRDPAATGYKVVQAGGTADLVFQPIGVGSSAATFTVCRESPIGSQERVVSVTATGVARVTRTETGSCP